MESVLFNMASLEEETFQKFTRFIRKFEKNVDKSGHPPDLKYSSIEPWTQLSDSMIAGELDKLLTDPDYTLAVGVLY